MTAYELSYPILSYVFVPEKMWTEHRAHIDTGWEQNLACGLKWHKNEDTYTKKHRSSSDHHKQKTVNILKMHAIQLIDFYTGTTYGLKKEINIE